MGEGSWETISSLKEASISCDFSVPTMRLWFPSLFFDVPESLQPSLSASHYGDIDIQIFCLDEYLFFVLAMFKTQTHLWKQEDRVLRISITKIVNLSVPSYNPYSTRQNWHIHERRTVNNKMGVQQQGTFLIRTGIQVFQIILSCLWKLTFLNNHIPAPSRCPGLLPT